VTNSLPKQSKVNLLPQQKQIYSPSSDSSSRENSKNEDEDSEINNSKLLKNQLLLAKARSVLSI
jgi:hypothetical protein